MIFTSPTYPHAQSAMCDVGPCTNAAGRYGHLITKVASPLIQRDLGGLVMPPGWWDNRSNPPIWVFCKNGIFCYLRCSIFPFSPFFNVSVRARICACIFQVRRGINVYRVRPQHTMIGSSDFGQNAFKYIHQSTPKTKKLSHY